MQGASTLEQGTASLLGQGPQGWWKQGRKGGALTVDAWRQVRRDPGAQRAWIDETVASFVHELDELPVFGAGAKAQVSFVSEGVVAEALSFWREPIAVDEVEVIHPYQALERVRSDERFAQLRPSSASVKPHVPRLGYFAMNPSSYQRFLIPVYSVRGNVSTEALDDYPFELWVVAVDANPEDIKGLGITANPAARHVFSGD